MKLPLYLDYNATTPIDHRVFEAMMPHLGEEFGNSASIDHLHGARASDAVEKARAAIAGTINARPEELLFTSGATESDNLALIGVMEANEDKGDHLITSKMEHPAVLETAKYLQKRGKHVTFLDVDRTGLLDPDAIAKAITNRTVLISVMMANNEIGTIEPVEVIGRIAHERGIYFHTDATQAIGKLSVDVRAMNIDLMSFSAHKVYGPKGMGALFIRRRNPFVKVSAQIHGGGHERGLRSGTINTAAVVGFSKALQLCYEALSSEPPRMQALRERLWQGLKSRVAGTELNGHPTKCIPNCLNVYLPGVENRALMLTMKDQLAFSAGSACATSKVEPSHVLTALGYSASRSHNSIRLSLGRPTTTEEVDLAIEEISRMANTIRNRFCSTAQS